MKRDQRNANKGTPRGRDMIERSLQDLGAGRSILVDKEGRIIAGNKTYEAWSQLVDEASVEVVHTNGEKLVVVQRDDLDLSEPNGLARRLAYLDNRTNEVDLSWDPEEILQDINAGMDLSDLWSDDELKVLLKSFEPDLPDISTEQKIEEIGSECLIEIMCTRAVLDDISSFLEELGETDGVTINISR